MPRRQGEISPRQAARMLEVHTKTVRGWCRRVRTGQPSKIRVVRLDAGGRYWLRRSEIKNLADNLLKNPENSF
jgi:transposase